MRAGNAASPLVLASTEVGAKKTAWITDNPRRDICTGGSACTKSISICPSSRRRILRCFAEVAWKLTSVAPIASAVWAIRSVKPVKSFLMTVSALPSLTNPAFSHCTNAASSNAIP